MEVGLSLHATIVVPLKFAGLWYGIGVYVCRCSRVWWPCSQFCITAFVACTVWHVISTSVVVLKFSVIVLVMGKEMPRCDSVQSPSLPPNSQVIQHDGTGEAPYERLHPCWGSGDDSGGASLL